MCPPQPEQAKLSSRSDDRSRPVESRRRARHHRRALDRSPDRDGLHRSPRASVGKALGPGGAMKGGVGTWATRAGDVVVGALVVLNAVGNVVDASGQILAGARGADGKPVEALRYLAQGGTPFGALSRSGGAGGAGGAGRNTTLAVVATNAQLDRGALQGR